MLLVIFINDVIVGCEFVVRGCVCLCCYLLLRFYFAPQCRPWGKIGTYSPPYTPQPLPIITDAVGYKDGVSSRSQGVRQVDD